MKSWLRQHRQAIEAAVSAGVRHIIYVSSVGARPGPVDGLLETHFVTEQAVMGSGLPWTLAAGTSLIGFLSMAEYISGRNFGIDDLLFHRAVHLTSVAYPGRMSPVTALVPPGTPK